MNLLDLPNEILGEVMQHTLALALACTRTCGVAKHARAILDAAERKVVADWSGAWTRANLGVDCHLSLAGDPTLLGARRVVREAGRARLQLIRALLYRFGYGEAARIRDYAHALRVMANHLPARPLRDLLGATRLTKEDLGFDARVGDDTRFVVTDCGTLTKMIEPWPNGVDPDPEADNFVKKPPEHPGGNSLGIRMCNFVTVPTLTVDMPLVIRMPHGQMVRVIAFGGFGRVADLIVCAMIEQERHPSGLTLWYHGWIAFVPTPFDLRCAAGCYGTIQ